VACRGKPSARGMPLQRGRGRLVWDDQQVLDIAAAWAVSHLDDGDAVLIADETADEKSSGNAAGAARQYGRQLHRSIRQRGMGYVMAVRAWHRMRTESGTKGTRHGVLLVRRRRHQHRARQARQRWNAYAETTP
jgi:SRSO17 transposase